MDISKIGRIFPFNSRKSEPTQNLDKQEPNQEEIKQDTQQIFSAAATAQAQAAIKLDNSPEAKQKAKESANIQKLHDLRTQISYTAQPKNPEDDFLMSAPKPQIYKEEGMEAYVTELAKKIAGYYNTDGLVIAKELLAKSKVDKEYADIILSEINAQLENIHWTPEPMPFTAEESKNNILEMSPIDVEAKKEELRAKYYEKLKQKHPAKESAKVILEQSPVDLGKRKIDLQTRYGEDLKAAKEVMAKYGLNLGQARYFLALQKHYPDCRDSVLLDTIKYHPTELIDGKVLYLKGKEDTPTE